MIADDITSIKTVLESDGRSLAGTATVTFSNGVSIEVKIINGQKGPFVGMPSRKTGNGWKDTVTFSTKDDLAAFRAAVMKAWENQQSDDVGEESFVVSDDEAF